MKTISIILTLSFLFVTIQTQTALAEKVGIPDKYVSLELGGLEEEYQGPIDREAVRTVMRHTESFFRRCYHRVGKPLEKDALVLLHFEVDPEGRTRFVNVLKSELDLPEVEKCLVAKISSSLFPKAGSDQVEVKYPLRFKKPEKLENASTLKVTFAGKGRPKLRFQESKFKSINLKLPRLKSLVEGCAAYLPNDTFQPTKNQMTVVFQNDEQEQTRKVSLQSTLRNDMAFKDCVERKFNEEIAIAK